MSTQTEKIVKVYSTPTCPFCKSVKKFLEENGIKYTELNVAEDVEARRTLVSRGQMGVPVTDINGEWVIGFDKGKLKQKLGL
ncbi:MAG: glutaredoxin family protein [Chloroflexi bacterium]|nr:glutaredoxin family protein [Chloroflexota bacterium]